MSAHSNIDKEKGKKKKTEKFTAMPLPQKHHPQIVQNTQKVICRECKNKNIDGGVYEYPTVLLRTSD
jgi:hypothetical protein